MTTSDPAAGGLTSELTRLTAELFARLPGPPAAVAVPQGLPTAAPGLPAVSPVLVPLGEAARVAAPPNPGPSALAVGAGGVSGAQNAPPTPGFLQAPPVASAPPPRESDLRNIPTTVSQAFGLPSPVLATASAPASLPGPYFLDLAGPPPGIAQGGELPGPAGLEALDVLDLGFVPAEHGATPVAAEAPEPPAPPALEGLDRALVPAERATVAPAGRIFDGHVIKRDFPILNERIHGQPLVWLDNAATTQKPRAVIERLTYYYEHENSNVHRAAHTLAARATDAYEGARDKVGRLLHAPSPKNIVFARGATEAINLVAQSWGRRNVGAGDEIVITWLEHHANIVPWQQLAAEKGARLLVAPVDDRGQVRLDDYERLLGPRTRIVSIAHVSNALGTIVPVREMVAAAHRHGARVLVDGAQAVSHMPVDVQEIDCDFYCFSGHKVFAPTGIGALFGKTEVLEAMPPWQGGGNMIADVTFEKTTYQPPPGRFEAGTGSIADAVGLGAAIDYLEGLGLANVSRYEHELLVYATEELVRVPGLCLVGTAAEKAGVLSFVLEGVPTEEVGKALNLEGIAVRSGHHCAQPILRRYGLESTVRASLAPYNTCEDIDALVAALLRITARGPGRRGF